MYEIFEELCKKNNVTPYRVAKETKIATSTLSDWKSGKSTPKQDKLKLIADFFNVSVDYLMTGKDKRFSEETADELFEILYAEKSIKMCFMKILSLPKEKQEYVISLVNMLEEKGE